MIIHLHSHRPHRPSPLKVSVVAKPVVVDDSFEGEYLKALHWTPTELQRSRKEAMLEAEAGAFDIHCLPLLSTPDRKKQQTNLLNN